MAVTLTPDQQTKLDAFEVAADAARQAGVDEQGASATLLTAQANADQTKVTSLADHAAALNAAQAFVDSMIPSTPPTTTPPPTTPPGPPATLA